MNIQPTIDLHTQNEFHFADNTDSYGCCCFWKSVTVRPNEYFINSEGEIEPFKEKGDISRSRWVANKRLAVLVNSRFQQDPIENDMALHELKMRLGDDFDGEEPITDEKLLRIVNLIQEIREEIYGSDSDA